MKVLRPNYKFEKNFIFPLSEFQVASHLRFERNIAYTLCHVSRLIKEVPHTSVTVASMELLTDVLSTLAD